MMENKVDKKMTTVDRDKSISRLTVDEVREEIREEVLWCWRLWAYLCAIFSIEFWVLKKPTPKEE